MKVTILNSGFKGLTLNLLSVTIVVFKTFHKSIKARLSGTKCVLKHKYLQMFGLRLNKKENFQPLEAVGRGSETICKRYSFHSHDCRKFHTAQISVQLTDMTNDHKTRRSPAIKHACIGLQHVKDYM